MFKLCFVQVLERTPESSASQVTGMLAKYIPGIVAETDIGAELSYTLPVAHMPRFSALLDAVEGNLTKLGISGYGIASTSMEQVFLM